MRVKRGEKTASRDRNLRANVREQMNCSRVREKKKGKILFRNVSSFH